MSLRFSWMNESGGLRYHARALTRASSLWRPFRADVRRWLEGWRPPERRLVLVGPSGGYCLERDWLAARFDSIACVDPDPGARLIFNARLRLDGVRWVRDDFFTRADLENGFAGLARLLAEEGECAVLFSNFLGQLHLLVDDDREEAVLGFWRKRLRELLAGRSWASFHDRFSGMVAPRLESPLAREHRLTDAEAVELCYGAGARGELLSHETHGFFPESLPHAYLSWPLAPGHWHLIEAVAGLREDLRQKAP